MCAVNLFDGSTALHRAIEHGDDYQAVRQLLIADPACLNLQNSRGLSPLHLACKLGRKKVIEMLLVSTAHENSCCLVLGFGVKVCFLFRLQKE